MGPRVISKCLLRKQSFHILLEALTQTNHSCPPQAVNKEMLGRGRIDSLVNANFDFEDWKPIDTSPNRRSRDFETDSDVAEDRASPSTSSVVEPASAQFWDAQGRQREARKRGADLNDKYYYPQDESLSSNSRNEDDVSNDLVDRPERDCEFICSFSWLSMT